MNQYCKLVRAFATKQPPLPKAPNFSGRGKFDKKEGKREFVQEHDYTITPETYIYLAEDNQESFERFPLLTSKALSRRSSKERPRRIRMLAREFMDDSLYNPHYGYFSQSAEIYSPQVPFDFNRIKNVDEFLDVWSKDFTKSVTPKSEPTPDTKDGHKAVDLRPKMRQIWHTPTELFHPYYGQTLAKYMVANQSADEPLEIYEMGAGNGTLMSDILDWMALNHPEIYARMSYNIIEISPTLALKQKAHVGKHASKVSIHNSSIFDWNKKVSSHCYFIALEVWDNFAHDVVRYDNTTLKPYQGYVVVDANGDFTQVFNGKLDSNLKRALNVRSGFDYRPNPKLGFHPLKQPAIWRYAKNYFTSFKGNLSDPEYVPTKYVDFLCTLKEYFPNHSLLASDFTHFGDRLSGYCSPVVQTFVEGEPIPISTFMAIQGYFDIMFPTDFRLSSQYYEAIMGRKATVFSHSDFLSRWTNKSETSTKAGENPMLSFYRNAAFLVS